MSDKDGVQGKERKGRKAWQVKTPSIAPSDSAPANGGPAQSAPSMPLDMEAEIVPGVTVKEYLEITRRMVEGSRSQTVNKR